MQLIAKALSHVGFFFLQIEKSSDGRSKGREVQKMEMVYHILFILFTQN